MAHWSDAEFTDRGGAVEAIAEEDIAGSYEFDAVAIVSNTRGFWVVSSSGCSCPSHEDNAAIDAGPFDTIDEAWKHVPESHRVGSLATVPNPQAPA